jgi:hypothetical protein
LEPGDLTKPARILHLDFINLAHGAAPEARRDVEMAAGALSAIEDVIDVGVIEGDETSDFNLAFWFALRDFEALEPFGTHPMYAAFLQGTVAPVLRGFAGADVKLEEDFESREGAATCVALTGPEESYDFEVRDALEGWARAAGAAPAAVGVAAGEKQMYRGAAIAFAATQDERPDLPPFRATVIRGNARRLGGRR